MPAHMPPPDNAKTDHHHDTAVRDSFPASDPVGNAASRGARAVAVADLHAPAAPTPATAIEQRFASTEAAKLALETLVREGPFDRRHAELLDIDGGAMLRIQTEAADADRLRGLLERTAG